MPVGKPSLTTLNLPLAARNLLPVVINRLAKLYRQLRHRPRRGAKQAKASRKRARGSSTSGSRTWLPARGAYRAMGAAPFAALGLNSVEILNADRA